MSDAFSLPRTAVCTIWRKELASAVRFHVGRLHTFKLFGDFASLKMTSKMLVAAPKTRR
jgi:hypothetical protein